MGSYTEVKAQRIKLNWILRPDNRGKLLAQPIYERIPIKKNNHKINMAAAEETNHVLEYEKSLTEEIDK